MVMRVPVGTLIKDLDTGNIMCDLDESGMEFVIAKGGSGGRGNAYYKSATNQTPRKAQDGRPGENFKIELELKLLADVGRIEDAIHEARICLRLRPQMAAVQKLIEDLSVLDKGTRK